MKHVQVRITADGAEADIHPMYDLWVNASFIERAIAIQWNFTGDALGMLHYAVGDVESFEAAVSEVPEVLGYDLVRASEESFYAYIRDATTDALGEVFGPITQGGVVVIPPIRYRTDGTVTFSLFGPDAEIQNTVETIQSPMDVTITEVGGLEGTPVAAETHLSPRQREAVQAAVELGYYDIPRNASHEEIAAALNCAPSTAAEHIRKAESTLLKSISER